jgi:hypothetical protein
MATATNIIHSSLFNFEYADKASAQRGNELIESIFVSQILPELEKAISKKIPAEVQIELSKLEINIGTIRENDLQENLAAKIRESLENALNFNFSKGINGKSISSDGQKPDDFLLQALEVFLLKGYFPFGVDRSMTFDKLVRLILQQNPAGLAEVLRRNRTQEQAIQRLAGNLSAPAFDELLAEQKPVDSPWIFKFKELLLTLKKELSLNQISDAVFTKMLNAFVLNFVLNETGPVFNREKFAGNGIRWFGDVFQTGDDLIAEVIEREQGSGQVSPVAEMALKQLRDEKSDSLVSVENQPLSVEQLMKLLNSGGEALHSWNLEFLKKEILLAIRNSKKRKQLIEKLNEPGTIFMVKLFQPEIGEELLTLIRKFIKDVVSRFSHKFSEETEKQVRHLIADAILYRNEQVARKLFPEEFILFLIYSAGLDQTKITGSSEFQNFIRSEKNIKPEKMRQVVASENLFPEVAHTYKILSDGAKEPGPDLNGMQPGSFVADALSKVYKKKIVLSFLVNGFLPEPFRGLNLHDVQQIFLELIQQNDDFLAQKIAKKDDTKKLAGRIKLLVPEGNQEILEGYFVHFFPEEHDGLVKILDEIAKQLALGEHSYLKTKPVKNEIFMLAMAENRGKIFPAVFRAVALKFLVAELVNDFHIPENLPRFFETDADKKQQKNSLEQDLEMIVKSLQFSETGVQFSRNELIAVIQRIVFYARLNPQLFRDSVQKYAGDQERIFSVFKLNLPDNQWKVLSEILSLLAGFKSFQYDSGVKELSFENKQFESYFTALSTLSPGTFSGKLTAEFWRSTVTEFGIQAVAQEKKLTDKTFAKLFRNHLLEKLKAADRPELFYSVVRKLEDSGSNELKKLVELWKISDWVEAKPKPKNEKEKQHQLKDLEQKVEILNFYALHGFLPWWANQLSFPELINHFIVLAGEVSEEFEEFFLEAEKENRIFEKLALQIPETARFEMDRLFTGNNRLRAKWEAALQNQANKKKAQDKAGEYPGKTEDRFGSITIGDFIEKAANDSDLLFKSLYNLTDDQILNQWLKEDYEVDRQIRPYLQLAPYFYFENITPAKWREAIYAFSLNFYQDDLKRPKSQFHAEFLKFIKTKYSRVNWDEVLKSVYYTVQQPVLKQKVVFPSELVRLLNLKTGLPDHIKELNKKMETKFSDEDAVVGVKVYNAGLVLFWPFLTRLFEHLSFVKNGEFVHPEYKNRAVYLLQYLVFNETEFPEYELVLNKILAGMEPEDHLEPFITLTKEEKELAGSLLHGLMNNWEKVKNSTPEGIQETFLQREGILRFKHEEVLLEVEKKGVDILVKSIPWNISLIKLSWMKKPMHVEWV